MDIYNPTRTPLPPLDSLTTFRSPSPSSDYFTQTTPSTTKLSNPRAQLLERWKSIADQIASKHISWDIVIALNRNLDTAENIFSSRAPLDESWKARLEDSGLSISNMADSESDVSFVSRPKPLVANAPEDTEDTEEVDGKRRIPHTDEALLARFTQAVAQLRKRQRGFKVCSLRFAQTRFLVPNHRIVSISTIWRLRNLKTRRRRSTSCERK